MIASTKYTPSNNITQKEVEYLKVKSKVRLTTETDLKKLLTEIENYKKAKEKKSVSLQEDKRRKEIDEQKKRNIVDPADELVGGEAKSDEIKPVIPKEKVATDSTSIAIAKIKALKEKHEKDTFLKETERILTDFITSPTSGVKVSQIDKKKE